MSTAEQTLLKSTCNKTNHRIFMINLTTLPLHKQTSTNAMLTATVCPLLLRPSTVWVKDHSKGVFEPIPFTGGGKLSDKFLDKTKELVQFGAGPVSLCGGSTQRKAGELRK